MANRYDKDVSMYIESVSEPLYSICVALRKTILCTNLNIVETFRWQIPFYDYSGMLCYINARKKDVALGFVYGAALDDAGGVFSERKRQVALVYFSSEDEVLALEKKVKKMIKRAIEFNRA